MRGADYQMDGQVEEGEQLDMITVYVDADGCPVKQEVYRVAGRYGLKVVLVANAPMSAPREEWIELVVVKGKFDAADDWIAAHATSADAVVTADVPLAARCVATGARVLTPTGRVFTEDSISDAVATRDLLTHLRGAGIMTGGPAPFSKTDRSRFLQQLDQIAQSLLAHEREISAENTP